MEKELKFRPLKANEIECRIQSVNKGGVVLLLYKDARVDQNILDETVGALNWQVNYSRDNQNCTISIYDEGKQAWVGKENVGIASKDIEPEKGLASDSFKRAAFCWGIGRELYTAPEMFVPAHKLKAYSNSDGKPQCYDRFKVKEILYDNGKIKSVTVGLMEYNREYDSIVFSNDIITRTVSPAPAIVNKPEPTPTPTPAPATAKTVVTASTSDALIADDEILLLGNCKNKVYGEVKDTEVFKSFLKWVKDSNTDYPDKERKEQFAKLKKLAETA